MAHGYSMSVIARLEVIPTREGSMSNAVASAVAALDEFDVSYETTPTDTVIEADDVGEVFAAAEAAHRAVGDERVITSIEVDEHRTRRQNRQERVESVERKLGHPARRERPASGTETRQRGEPAPETRQREASETELRRYHGPVQTQGGQRRETRPAEARTTESRQTTSRYLRPRRPVSR